MPYTALPDRRMPYDNDGSVLVASAGAYTNGATQYPTGAQLAALNGFGTVGSGFVYLSDDTGAEGFWIFFPESREVTGMCLTFVGAMAFLGSPVVQGSSDSTNGLDGTWETATVVNVASTVANGVDVWRANVRSVSLTGSKKAIRCYFSFGSHTGSALTLIHVYGEKAAGETPDDLLFIDVDTTGVEYTAPEDFGDRPLGTTVVRQFRVKNDSATLTANTINLQCNDADFAISTDGVTWVVTINIASLAPGAESATMYIRNTTPAPGNPLGPRTSRIVAIVGSWS